MNFKKIFLRHNTYLCTLSFYEKNFFVGFMLTYVPKDKLQQHPPNLSKNTVDVEISNKRAFPQHGTSHEKNFFFFGGMKVVSDLCVKGFEKN